MLDATCGVNSTQCNTYLTGLALDMTSTTTCGQDLDNGIAVVEQIRLGLLAYQTMYTASCLKDNSTGSYCYADAITNSTSPTDSYIYYLPLNQSLVGGSQPTCSTCLQATMNVFQAAAANSSNTVSGVYASSARLINGLCGPGFVNATIPTLTKNAARRLGLDWLGGVLISAIIGLMVI